MNTITRELPRRRPSALVYARAIEPATSIRIVSYGIALAISLGMWAAIILSIRAALY